MNTGGHCPEDCPVDGLTGRVNHRDYITNLYPGGPALKINRLGIPLFVFIITDSIGSAEMDPDLLIDQPGSFTVLRTGMIQEDIDQSDFPKNPSPHKK